ncbi:8-oxo-dGTP pyrophosphatase MutT (NUDIX family) [Nocardiopsis mwathae]|uniref:8-oxo-dGTP pyrophosphatase MutT (NUDIX family) n=1 Tax=Nocardiopsis mwathae TaxID=1472723 RepID=A0A7W9YLI8_9ACTN|nr:NUDIX hydrolase [Nocardiopsis mwathae]MBB6174210.1 8-oxo-dGTP pyrophosphatase MutT (NUDIX family) [Nocardiopsis mwathae]
MSASDGDGWVRLPDGSRRWGRFGASGLLLHAGDGGGDGAGGSSGGYVLLQHRALWGHMGGTWGTPGGALDSGESPVQAALREFGEEVAGDLGDVALNGVHRQEHEVWRYDTVLAHSAHRSAFTPGSAESTEIRWVALDEVERLRLLPPFRSIWPGLREALTQRLVVVVDAAAVLRHRQGGHGAWPESAAGDAAVAAAGRLRDELALLAASGVDGALLPDALALTPLHRWFPHILLLVDGDARSVASVPGVEVVATPRGKAASGAASGRPCGPGANGANSANGAHAPRTLVVTTPESADGGRAAAGAGDPGGGGSAPVAVPPDWLLKAAT